jgi:DNA (cytosine-5)-methyltransferase 1
MTHGSLFSGIGGFDLAAEWMGWENVFHCEWLPFGQKVLHHYWPTAESFLDISKVNFTPYANKINVLTGGFPCQPYSIIGEQKGISDERHLWPEYLRAIREIGPDWAVPENVPGLISWSDGMVFEQICTDLEAEGYEVAPVILPACSVGTAHRRDRIWIIAHSIKRRLERRHSVDPKRYGQAPNRPVQALVEDRDWYSFAQSFVHGDLHGISDRVDRNKALGNAIVPQVALQIFRTIEAFEK